MRCLNPKRKTKLRWTQWIFLSVRQCVMCLFFSINFQMDRHMPNNITVFTEAEKFLMTAFKKCI